MHDKLIQKLEILSDAYMTFMQGFRFKRKYKVDKKGIDSLTGGSGICHSFTLMVDAYHYLRSNDQLLHIRLPLLHQWVSATFNEPVLPLKKQLI